eukprot:scaffold115572_cov69-Phaeocystis_antarctica.AAC.6
MSSGARHSVSSRSSPISTYGRSTTSAPSCLSTALRFSTPFFSRMRASRVVVRQPEQSTSTKAGTKATSTSLHRGVGGLGYVAGECGWVWCGARSRKIAARSPAAQFEAGAHRFANWPHTARKRASFRGTRVSVPISQSSVTSLRRNLPQSLYARMTVVSRSSSTARVESLATAGVRVGLRLDLRPRPRLRQRLVLWPEA